jgi:hypothetical protein
MMNKKKQKRRLRKSLASRRNELLKIELDKAWRRVFVKSGILQEKK